MGNPVQQTVDQLAQATTNLPATGATVSGGVLGWVLGNQGEILFFLSVSLMLCQLVAWGYKGYRWLKTRNAPGDIEEG